MDKFHFNKMMNEANKAKKALINQKKHSLVYGKPDQETITARLAFLSEIGVNFYNEYNWIESRRRQGLLIA